MTPIIWLAMQYYDAAHHKMLICFLRIPLKCISKDKVFFIFTSFMLLVSSLNLCEMYTEPFENGPSVEAHNLL